MLTGTSPAKVMWHTSWLGVEVDDDVVLGLPRLSQTVGTRAMRNPQSRRLLADQRRATRDAIAGYLEEQANNLNSLRH